MDTNNIIMIAIGILVISSALTILKDMLGKFLPIIILIGFYLITQGIVTADMVVPYIDMIMDFFVNSLALISDFITGLLT